MDAAPRTGHLPEDPSGFLASEGVPAGGRLLDVPCGVGRRALALAERGFDVTAVDANEIGIGAARARVPPALRPRLRYAAAPREALPGAVPGRGFDAILCLDHAIAREDSSGDVPFLARLADACAPGGLLVLELLHRDFFSSRPKGFSFRILRDVEQHEVRSFDPVEGVLDLTWTVYRRDGESLRHRGDSASRLRLLAPHETAARLASAGWRLEHAYGSWSRAPVSSDRRKILLVARPAPLP